MYVACGVGEFENNQLTIYLAMNCVQPMPFYLSITDITLYLKSENAYNVFQYIEHGCMFNHIHVKDTLRITYSYGIKFI